MTHIAACSYLRITWAKYVSVNVLPQKVLYFEMLTWFVHKIKWEGTNVLQTIRYSEIGFLFVFLHVIWVKHVQRCQLPTNCFHKCHLLFFLLFFPCVECVQIISFMQSLTVFQVPSSKNIFDHRPNIVLRAFMIMCPTDNCVLVKFSRTCFKAHGGTRA